MAAWFWGAKNYPVPKGQTSKNLKLLWFKFECKRVVFKYVMKFDAVTAVCKYF